jgi:hypothetical protein
MDQASGPSVDATSFDYTVKVEASEARFEVLETMTYLDLDRLTQADRARIAIGKVETDCCSGLVFGIVERGMLSAIEFDRDEGADPQVADVDPGTLELVKAASAALGVQAAPRKLPIPFSDLVANPRIVIETWQCVHICIFGFCITCCWGDGPVGPWGICSPIERFAR